MRKRGDCVQKLYYYSAADSIAGVASIVEALAAARQRAVHFLAVKFPTAKKK